jgi:hypothetical protein
VSTRGRMNIEHPDVQRDLMPSFPSSASWCWHQRTSSSALLRRWRAIPARNGFRPRRHTTIRPAAKGGPASLFAMHLIAMLAGQRDRPAPATSGAQSPQPRHRAMMPHFRCSAAREAYIRARIGSGPSRLPKRT